MAEAQPYMPLALLLVGLVALGFVVRLARSAYLRRVSLTEEEIRELQVQITDVARRASIQPGMEIDLHPFWTKSGIKEPDRRAVIHPLVDTQVFGWYERRSADGFENFLAGVGRALWMPTRSKVVVSQWVKDNTARGEGASVIIESVLGGIHMNDFSITHGDRAGRDVIGGDKVGRDKAGGDAHGVTAGGSVVSSGNVGSTHEGKVRIETPEALRAALAALAEEARARGESAAVIEALQWAANGAISGDQPSPHDQARHQRTLDKAGEWLQSALGSIAEGVTGALTGHWIMSIIRG